MSFLDELKSTLQVGRVKKMFRVGTEVFGACQPFIEKPTWWNAGKAALGIGKVLVDDVEVWSHDYFDGDEWTLPYSRDFNGTILGVLSKFPFQTMRTAEENSFVRIVDMGGIKAGYIYNSRLNTVDNIYVETSKLNEAREIIKKLLWEQFQGQPLVMRHNRRMVISSDEPRIVFEVDDAFHPMPSEKATEYSAYLKRCLDADVPRSVMLYGPPGTGKSTMARTLVETLGLRSFRIRVEDVSGLENSTLFEAITIFEPDAVILDDFDRAHAQAALLETLEFFQRHVKLVVSTVNDKSQLDEALLRPGRFDELVLIDKMDEGVVRLILGEYADGFETVKDWPIAFIQEYVKRRRFMSADEAAKSTEELARRVRRLDKYRGDQEEDETGRMLRIMKKRGTGGLLVEDLEGVEEEDEDEEEVPPRPQASAKPGASTSFEDFLKENKIVPWEEVSPRLKKRLNRIVQRFRKAGR
jgi:adenylate kinase family enzyme